MNAYSEITFFDAYVQAALWSSNDESRPDGGDPLDKNYVPADIDRETLERMRTDCARFQAENEGLLTRFYRELPTNAWTGEAQGGQDFWLSRNGHGAGFFDHEVSRDVIDALQEKAEAFGYFELRVGDDKHIYA